MCLQVGSVNNTFGIKGVKEHCMFFKSIEDAGALRRRISECFERAALPYVSRPSSTHAPCLLYKLWGCFVVVQDSSRKHCSLISCDLPMSGFMLH